MGQNQNSISLSYFHDSNLLQRAVKSSISVIIGIKMILTSVSIYLRYLEARRHNFILQNLHQTNFILLNPNIAVANAVRPRQAASRGA